MIEQITVGVDPSGGKDLWSIVVAALLTDGRLAVLADRSCSGNPGAMGRRRCPGARRLRCRRRGGRDQLWRRPPTEVVKQAASRAFDQGRRETNLIRIKEVSASRGKTLRAEPVSLQYEKGRVLHRRGLDKLEAEMLSFSRDWDRDVDGSPNRLDAAIWALTRLGKVITSVPIA